jgi:hypothetical protein
VRVAAGRDRLVPRDSPLLVVDVSSRCEGPAEVHFEALAARGEAADGAPVPLVVFDPRREIHAARIAPYASGTEALELDPPSPAEGKSLASLCVDLTRLAPAASALPPVCFHREDGELVPDEPGATAPSRPEEQPAASMAAVEVSGVVGYRRRTHFGAGWESGHVDDPAIPSVSGRALRFSSYDVGSLMAPAASARRVGCLEVQVEGKAAPGRRRSADVRLRFGNACRHMLSLDFRAVRAVVRAPDGGERAMTVYDPAGELGVFDLDARDDGAMAVQFDAPDRTPEGGAVCVDLTGLVVDPRAERVEPVCFEHAEPATSDADVVGHQPYTPPNTPFRPHPWRFYEEVSASVQLVDFGATSFSGTLADGRRFSVGGAAFGRQPSYALDLRFGPFFGDRFYAGPWIRTGGAYLGGMPSVNGGGGINLKPDVGIVDVTGGAVLGAALVQSASLRLRGELGAGVRVFAIDMAPLGCSVGDDSCTRHSVAILSDVEPRLALDVWLSPWWSLGGWVSADVTHLPDLGGGVGITLHTRGYDGVR